MNDYRFILKQKTNSCQLAAYLLHTLQNTLGLSWRRFFIAFDVLSQKALIHSNSFRKCLCINDLVKIKKLWQIQIYLQFLFSYSFPLSLKIKIKRFQNIGFEFFQRTANSINRIFFGISRITCFSSFNNHINFHSTIFLFDASIFFNFLFQPFTYFMAAMIRTNNLPFFKSMFHNHVAACLPYCKPAVFFKQPYQFAGFHFPKVINLLLYAKV